MHEQVLIIGAGPTGLVLALWLTRLGVRVRILDKADGPGTTSRAFAVHARTLEFHDQMGIADDVAGAGSHARFLNIHFYRKLRARVPFGDFGSGLSQFPFILMLPQDEHERILGDHLKRQGVTVEWRTELLDFENNEEGIAARLKRADDLPETHEFAFLCACDGAHSTVREQLEVGFPGGTYDEIFYVADVVARGRLADREFHFTLTRIDFCGVFPLRGDNRLRLIGVVLPEARSASLITYQDIVPQVARTVDVTVEAVNWFSTYHVHHRIAGAFRRGRVFLLGDAAHIHSPAGGQGMNTGIGDAVNLSWKLAAVLQGRAGSALLDSYDPERRAVARRIVKTTDRIFAFQVSHYPGRHLVRWIFFTVWPSLMRLRLFSRLMFRTMSQIALNYRAGPLVEGRAGRVQGGDRLPWVASADGTSNFIPLRSLAWQVHVYGGASAEIRRLCDAHRLALYEAPWQQNFPAAGLRRDAVYLIRPDGYIAFAAAEQDAPALERFLAKPELRSRTVP
jgi:2-polyprenyl-6-methoxyphenol hydroxylase-like FAD-dependent oxidoreductase